MKKWWVIIAVVLLTACSSETVSEPVRVQLEQVNGQVLEIFDEAQVDFVAAQMQSVNWQPNVQPEMARKEDVTLYLFISTDPNMPEYIITYRIWVERNHSLTLISNDVSEGYGQVSAEEASELLQFIQQQQTFAQPVIDQHEEVTNVENFEHFLENVEAKRAASVKIVRYTTEGAPIYVDARYDGTDFEVTLDTTADTYGAQEVNKYTCKTLRVLHNGQEMQYRLQQCDGNASSLVLLSLPFMPEAQLTKQHLPNATLQIGDKELALQKGAYTWTMPTGKLGESVTVTTDHLAPSDMLNLDDAVQVDALAKRTIHFEVEPTEVKYHIWNADKMLASEVSLAQLPLTEPFILEVVAHFGDSRLSYVCALTFQ